MQKIRYPSYKPSHIDWIGNIPAHWEVRKLKQFFVFEKGRNAALYTKEYVGANEGNYPVFSGQTENEGILGRINTYDYDLPKVLFVTTVGAKAMTLRYVSGKFSLSQNCAILYEREEKCTDLKFY